MPGKQLRGEYVGSVPVTLTVYEMPWYGHTAFDAIQQWHVLPGELAFYKSDHFGIAQSTTASQGDLYRFVHSLWVEGKSCDRPKRAQRRLWMLAKESALPPPKNILAIPE
jgi:hypothetical protein